MRPNESVRPNERWILVCDASRARLFKQHTQTRRFDLVREAEHPESRERVRELVTDATGRKPVGTPLGASYGGRSVSLGHGGIGAAPHSDPKEVEATKFARELSAMLQRGLLDHAYDTVVLVAPPAFLGVLQSALGDEVARRVEARVSKDLTKTDPRELPERLSEELAS